MQTVLYQSICGCCMTRSRCEYCKNAATRNAHNPHNDQLESLCEIHYAYLKPSRARVNPINIDRCIRCGNKSTDKRGRNERLIEHHVNYPLDITVPVCDSCHAEIHSGEDPEYLERHERQNSPFEPIGSKDSTGLAIDSKYETNAERDMNCPECNETLIRPPSGMGFDCHSLCPNAECCETGISEMDLFM